MIIHNYLEELYPNFSRTSASLDAALKKKKFPYWMCLRFLSFFFFNVDSPRRRKRDLQTAATDGHRETVFRSQTHHTFSFTPVSHRNVFQVNFILHFVT